jgi:hypothetical protein
MPGRAFVDLYGRYILLNHRGLGPGRRLVPREPSTSPYPSRTSGRVPVGRSVATTSSAVSSTSTSGLPDPAALAPQLPEALPSDRAIFHRVIVSAP